MSTRLVGAGTSNGYGGNAGAVCVVSRRHVVRGMPMMLVIAVLAGGASCSGSDSDAPGRYNFPKVKEGHQYFMSEKDREALRQQAKKDG